MILFKSKLLKIIICVLISTCANIYGQTLFWETEIAHALTTKEDYYHKAEIDSLQYAAMSRYNNPLTLKGLPGELSSPWPFFLRGIVSSGDSTSMASSYFAKAINATEKDPGLTWVLAQEFDRCGQKLWQEKCMKKLELLFILNGCQSVPIICQQFLHKSTLVPLGKKPGQDELDANGVWIEKFDRHALLPTLLSIKHRGILNSSFTLMSLNKIVAKINGSWELQLIGVQQAIRLLCFGGMLFIIIVFIIISVKYLPQILHQYAEKLPATFTHKTRQFLTLLIFISIVLIGIIPFFWIFLFLAWQHIRGKDKILAGISIMLFMLLPVGLHVITLSESCLLPNNSVTLFRKSLDEGYYPALDALIHAKIVANSHDYLAQTAAATLDLKQSNIPAATTHIKAAYTLKPNDPMVMLTLGNTLYLGGELQDAKNMYLQCIKQHPTFVPPYFNVGQLFFNSMETTKGIEFLAQATKRDPLFVNSFIKKNDDFFSKEWPITRQMLPADYSHLYFWKSVFFEYCGNIDTTNKRFGTLFFGIGIIEYTFISVLLLLLLAGITILSNGPHSIKKVTLCKLCLTPMCRKCKKGNICPTCFNTTQHIRNENIRQRIMSKIQTKTYKIRAITTALFDIVFPGSGMLYFGKPLYKTIPTILVTCIIYSFYLSIFTIATYYPVFTLNTIVTPVFAIGAAYNAFFVIRSGIRIIKELKHRGD